MAPSPCRSPVAAMSAPVSLAEIELVRGRRVTVEDWLRARAELNASYERTKTRKAGQHV